jgi:hypothetical protein
MWYSVSGSSERISSAKMSLLQINGKWMVCMRLVNHGPRMRQSGRSASVRFQAGRKARRGQIEGLSESSIPVLRFVSWLVSDCLLFVLVF